MRARWESRTSENLARTKRFFTDLRRVSKPRQGRKNIAHGASRGNVSPCAWLSPSGAKETSDLLFRPAGADRLAHTGTPRLAPWASFFRHSVAGCARGIPRYSVGNKNFFSPRPPRATPGHPATCLRAVCSRFSANCRNLPQTLWMAVSFVRTMTASRPSTNLAHRSGFWGVFLVWKRPPGSASLRPWLLSAAGFGARDRRVEAGWRATGLQNSLTAAHRHGDNVRRMLRWHSRPAFGNMDAKPLKLYG